ncbi:MAG: hypothetical protein RLZZ330_6 [Actinomycetota bacterium]|jgi:hypothetical protein
MANSPKQHEPESHPEALTRPAAPKWFNYEDPIWSEIVPGLWQGGTNDVDIVGNPLPAPIISAENFDTVVTMYAYANPVDWFVKELRFAIYDHDIEHFDLEELFSVVKFAHADWKKGKRVLVRCQAGLNRSGLVTALILIRDGYTPQEAITKQRLNRDASVLFNQRFEKWLMNLDVDVWRADVYPSTSSSPDNVDSRSAA